jgi:phosphopantothenoylcysteine decarboxylase/phosphopantothenate--cysteine ligase
MRPMKVLLGVCGGIAAYKAPELVRHFQKAGHQVAVALTPAATRFVSPLVLRTLADGGVLEDIFSTEERVAHVALADWADVVAVAPATAHTLARLATGMADEPVSLCFLATRARRIVFPAMNVNMWINPATQANVACLRQRGVEVVEPESGELACGWEGAGRLPGLDRIVELTVAAASGGDFSGVRVLVTAGPTREYLDPVRFLSNPSTGTMGFAIAARAASRGAEVTLVSGPVALPTPAGVRRIDVVSAADMREAVFAELAARPAQVVIAAAAVADYRPLQRAFQKLKKGEARRSVELERTEDVLAELVRSFHPPVRVGFAAETENILANARDKLLRKDLSLVVANDVSAGSGAFGDALTTVWFVEREGEPVEVAAASKGAVADRLLDVVRRHLDAATHPDKTPSGS